MNFAPNNYVNPEVWVEKLHELTEKLHPEDYDVIVALKRSGLMVGVFLSHNLRLPLFTHAEIQFLGDHHQRVLLVDTTCWSGRSLRKVISKIEKTGRTVVDVWVLYQLFGSTTNIKQLHSLEYNDKVMVFWWSPEYIEKKVKNNG